MVVIGLTGTVCSGKSAVAGAFRDLGARVYGADDEVHRIYRREDVKREVREAFGDAAFGADGEVDRKALARTVFGDPAKLAKLTGSIVFPRVAEAIRRAVQEARSDPAAGRALVLDAPTLFEAKCEGLCDKVLFVTAPPDRRREWARAGRGWGPDEIERRERHLIGEVAKRGRADKVIENTGSLDDLKRQVLETWKEWIHAV